MAGKERGRLGEKPDRALRTGAEHCGPRDLPGTKVERSCECFQGQQEALWGLNDVRRQSGPRAWRHQ